MTRFPPSDLRATLLAAATILSAACMNRPLSTGSGAGSGAPPSSPSPIERFVDRAAPFTLSGAVLAVVDTGTVLRRGYGLADRERGTPITTSTIFDIGSLTKQFTAAAILVLAEQGRLALHDSLGRFFDDVPADKQGITIHHLLAHTAGLDPEAEGADEDWVSRDSLVREALHAKLARAPGEGWDYSNTGYSLLAAIIEIASSRPYEAFVYEEVLRPAGMERTGYRRPAWNPDSIAVGYRRGERRGTPLEQPGWQADGPTWYLRGNGGMLSSVDDLGRFLSALRSGRLMSDESRRLMLRPHAPMDADLHRYYGYGWALEGVNGDVVWHNGANGIFYAEWFWDRRSDRMLVVLTNQTDAANVATETVLSLFIAEAFAVLQGAPAPTVPCCVAALSSGGLAAYEGTYRLESGGELRVTAQDDGLRVDPQDQQAVNALLLGAPAQDSMLSANTAHVTQLLARGLSELAHPADSATRAAASREASLIQRFLRSATTRVGEIRSAEVMGTTGLWFARPPTDGRFATFVRLHGARGELLLPIAWRDGALSGWFPHQFPSPASVTYLPAADGGFITYHPRLPVRQRLTFDGDPRQPTTMVLGAPGDQLAARRVR